MTQRTLGSIFSSWDQIGAEVPPRDPIEDEDEDDEEDGDEDDGREPAVIREPDED
jgi:hypothetical protein